MLWYACMLCHCCFEAQRRGWLWCSGVDLVEERVDKNIYTVTHSCLSRSLYTINYFCRLLGRVVETLLHINLRHALCIQSQHCFLFTCCHCQCCWCSLDCCLAPAFPVLSVGHMFCKCVKDGRCSQWNVHHLPIIIHLVVLFVMSCMIHFVQFLLTASALLWLFVENCFLKFIYVNTYYYYYWIWASAPKALSFSVMIWWFMVQEMFPCR